MTQLDLFDNDFNARPSKSPHTTLTTIKNGEYLYIGNFFEKTESDNFFKLLRNNICWTQESMLIYGKTIPFPRLTAWYGDKNRSYSFSGITLQPHYWIPVLLDIKHRIEPTAKINFNSVLLNLYRNGNDSISWHTDAETELGLNPIIASVNFGETRKFQMKHINTNERIDIELEHGSLLVMQGELQHFWKHQVPKTNKLTGERINLTFRVIK